MHYATDNLIIAFAEDATSVLADSIQFRSSNRIELEIGLNVGWFSAGKLKPVFQRKISTVVLKNFATRFYCLPETPRTICLSA